MTSTQRDTVYRKWEQMLLQATKPEKVEFYEVKPFASGHVMGGSEVIASRTFSWTDSKQHEFLVNCFQSTNWLSGSNTYGNGTWYDLTIATSPGGSQQITIPIATCSSCTLNNSNNHNNSFLYRYNAPTTARTVTFTLRWHQNCVNQINVENENDVRVAIAHFTTKTIGYPAKNFLTYIQDKGM